MIRSLLIWAAVVGMFHAFTVIPVMIRNPREKPFWKALYCVVLGPSSWIVIIVVLFVAAIGSSAIIWKRSRAKKTTP